MNILRQFLFLSFLFLIVSVSSVTSAFAQSTGTAFDVQIENIAFESSSDEILITLDITNTTNVYTDGLTISTEFFEGSVLRSSGDIFGDLDFIFADTVGVDMFAPQETEKVAYRVQVPKYIPEGDYFLRISIANGFATRYGLAYTQEPITLPGLTEPGDYDLTTLRTEGDKTGSTTGDSTNPTFILTLPDTYTYTEGDQVHVFVIQEGFRSKQLIEKSIYIESGVEGTDRQEVIFTLEDAPFETPGVYTVIAQVEHAGGIGVFPKDMITITTRESQPVVSDIVLSTNEFKKGEQFDGAISIASQTTEPFRVEVSFGEAYENFVIKQEVTPVDTGVTTTIDLHKYEVPFDMRFSDITVTIRDIDSDTTYDTATLHIDVSTQQSSSSMMIVYIVFGLIVVAVLFYFMYKKQTRKVLTPSLVLFVLVGSVVYIQHASALVENTAQHIVLSYEAVGTTCPHTQTVALTGSSYCAHDGRSVSGTVAIDVKKSSDPEWNTAETFIYTSSPFSKIYGPYIHEVSIDSELDTQVVRGVFAVDENASSTCASYEPLYTQTHSFSCATDVCTNVDGVQLVIPEAGDRLTAYGDTNRVGELGVVVRNQNQCFLGCSDDVVCPSSYSCVDDVAGPSYCRPDVEVQCVASADLDFSRQQSTFTLGQQVYLKVLGEIAGTEYSYDWSGVTDTIDEQTAVASYDAYGEYAPTITISSDTGTESVSCPVSIRQCLQDADCRLGTQCSTDGYCVDSPLTASCGAFIDATSIAQLEQTETQANVFWSVKTQGGTAPYTYTWQGDVVGSAQTIPMKYGIPGEKKVMVTVQDSSEYAQEITVGCDLFVRECAYEDDPVCTNGTVCRPDFLCGPAYPDIMSFNVTEARFTSTNGSCNVGVIARNVSKCSVISVSTGSKIGVIPQYGSYIDADVTVIPGSYVLECKNDFGDTVTHDEKIMCAPGV